MLHRALDRFSSFVVHRRGLVLAFVVAVLIACAAQLPRLRTDSSPENLIVSFGGYEDDEREFRAQFGNPDSVVALLVRADDVTTRRPLDYVHRLSTHFDRDPRILRVESLTITPLPGAGPREEEASLETLDTLDDLDEPSIDPRVEAALEVLIASEPERFRMGFLDVAQRVGDGSQALSGVVRGERVTDRDARTIAAALDESPLVSGRLVSRDRTLTAVVLFLDPEIGTGARRVELVHEIDAWLAAHPPPRGTSIHTAGIPHLRVAIEDAMLEDQTFLVPLSLFLCALLLYASFRWIAGVVLPIAMVSITVVCVIGVMALAGEPMSILMNMLPTLLIIMGISEAVHVVGRYTEECRHESDRKQAAVSVLKKLMTACFLTSFTTAVGFGALIVAQTEMLRRFGVVSAIGVMISYVILITFIPAAITFFAPPKRRRAVARAGWLEALLVRGTAAVCRRPLWVVIGAALVVAPCAWAYASIEVDADLLGTFDDDDEVVVSTHLVEQHLDGILPLQFHVRGRDLRDPELLAALDRCAAWASEQEGVLRTTTPGDYLWEAYRPIAGIAADAPRAPFRSRAQVDALIALVDRVEPSPLLDVMSADGRHARFEVRLRDMSAQESVALIHAIEAHTERELAPFDVEITVLGEAFIGSRGVTSVVEDLFGSLALSALVIFLTIGVLFRSVKIGLYAIPPNVMPQLGTVAWMVLRGVPLNAGTAIVFSVAIGVTVDLTIHGLARLMEEERRGMRRRAALVRVARSTGRAIVMSSATLVVGFSVLLFSGFVPVRQFGELIAIALVLSLATTLVFQPAMLALFVTSRASRRKAR
jgi:predicted RND superfamily exporter protein